MQIKVHAVYRCIKNKKLNKKLKLIPVLSITVNINRLNDDLDRIYHWAKANDLRWNPHKPKFMVIRTLDSNIGLVVLMNGEKIKIVDAAKKLGLTVNDNLAWTNHVNTLVGQTYMKLRCLWLTQYFTPLNSRRLIAKCYLLPGSMCGCELFASCNSVSKEKFNVLFNNIVR